MPPTDQNTRSRRTPVLRLAGFAILPAFVGGPVASATTLTLTVTPSAPVVQVGDTFTVDFTASLTDVSGPDVALAGWSFDLPFDAGLASHDPFTDVSVDGMWNAFSDDGDGLGGWTLPSFDDPPIQLDIPLATLTFTATDAGILVLDPTLTAGVDGFGLIAGGDTPLLPDEIVFVGGLVTIVQVIPLPPAALLGAGMLVPVVIARRRLHPSA